MPGVRVERNDTEYEARLRRGNVTDYGTRWIEVRRDGLWFRIKPDDIPGIIHVLGAIWDAIVDEDLRPPSCIFCGEEFETVDDAERHHAEEHADRAWSGGDGFDAYKYEIDPEGTIARLREQDRIRTDGGADDIGWFAVTMQAKKSDGSPISDGGIHLSVEPDGFDVEIRDGGVVIVTFPDADTNTESLLIFDPDAFEQFLRALREGRTEMECPHCGEINDREAVKHQGVCWNCRGEIPL